MFDRGGYISDEIGIHLAPANSSCLVKSAKCLQGLVQIHCQHGDVGVRVVQGGMGRLQSHSGRLQSLMQLCRQIRPAMSPVAQRTIRIAQNFL